MQRFSLVTHYVKTPLNLAKISLLKERFDLIEKERNLVLFGLGKERFLCVYSYGVVAFFGIEVAEISDLIELIRETDGGEELMVDKEIGSVTDTVEVVVDPEQPEAVEFDFVRIRSTEPEKMLVIFNVVAQSVMLDYLERGADDMLGRFEKIHAELARSGRLTARVRGVTRMIGRNSAIVHFIIGKLSFLDKPDVTWEDKGYESLFDKLRKEYELDDRFHALQFKLEFVQDSSELMLDMIATRRDQALELIIILLIVFEIIMAFFPGA